MLDFFRNLFGSEFMPHGHCYFWEPSVLWLNVVSDVVIALAYYSIPLILFSFARKRTDLSFSWIFLAFAAFIFACGTTHVMGVWTVWNPTYRLDGVIKAITAVASIATAIALWQLVPALLVMPSPAQLQEINEALANEIEERRAAEERVRLINEELERRVAARTLELTTANERLSSTNRELSEEMAQRRHLQEQLMQSQKMEAIGRLAGGVAHDFNNLLTVILGFSDLVLSGADRSTATYSQVEQIRVAAERAASLTQQLLAFSRKQMLQPKVINLNSVVMEIEKMLRRLMGDDIELTTILARDLGQVRADPTQIEQVIMNLAVNARDAMPRGGRLTIETANVELSEEYAREHVEARAGPHVMLAITDTGIGMDQTTKERIFEPFFTTKEYGKGTGLGLSTVFGIVKQSGGSLWVYSEPGQGSVFKIYLPRVEEAVVEAPEIEAPDARGTETILVVEDDEKVRLLVRTVLSARGYTVFEAAKPSEALMFQHRYTGPIHLLLTDVVLPEMSGQELSEKLLALHPRLKVLFMSGYTDRSISLGTAAFIQKPFTPEALGRKIREVLEGR
ncbi:MAG TPA: ATP-binding protein [Bryobacteraceae bacterium]|nr:ATP-binding protein [Bryobacteraceae bacterium]